MAIIIGGGSAVSSGSGGSGGASIAKDMFFADIAARDRFTTANPDRVYQGVACAVVNGAAYDYYQWDATSYQWRDANLIFQGKDGANGVDGRGIDSATIEGDNLNLEYSDGTSQEVGRVVGRDGVVQSLIAGSNVTIDSSDPAHPVISSTGGGGVDPLKILDIEVFGDLNASAWGSLTTGTYELIGFGNQFNNLPEHLGILPSATYTLLIDFKNSSELYNQYVVLMTNADWENQGRELVRTGVTKTSAEGLGWHTFAFLRDIASSGDPSEGFELKPDKNIGLDSTSAVMIKNNAGNYHNAIDQDINFDAIRIGSQAMKTYLRTNEDHIQVQTTSGMKTIAHLEDVPKELVAARKSYWIRENTYSISPDDLHKEILLMCQPFVKIDDVKTVEVTFPSQQEFEERFYIPDITDESLKDALPHIESFKFSIYMDRYLSPDDDHKVVLKSDGDWLPFVSSASLSQKEGVYLYFKGGQNRDPKVHTFSFMKPLNPNPDVGVWGGYDYQNPHPQDWTPIGEPPPEDNALYQAQNLNLRNDDNGNLYVGVDRQSPVKTTDATTNKFRLIRIVAPETENTIPTVKTVQPPEIGSGFSLFDAESVPQDTQILQISSGTYSLSVLGIDPLSVDYGDAVYVQPDGSLGRDFTRYQCGWVLTSGVIIDIDLYNASALSEGGFPTDPIFNSVTSNLFRSDVSPNNALQFNGSTGILKTNDDLELSPTSNLKFKVGGVQKAVLTSVRLDMNNTPISNVPDAVLDHDVAAWKQIRDYVDSHIPSTPEDLNVTSVTASGYIKTPVLSVPSTDLNIKISDQDAAKFSLGSVDLKTDANNNNGTNVTGVYKVIGANADSHIAIPNANMVLYARETIALQDDGSDYVYFNRNQGLNFAGTNAAVLPDYGNSGIYLRGDKVGFKNWSGNDVLTLDKSLGDIINANNHRIENILAPQFDTDAANKKFVTEITDSLDSRISTLETTVEQQAEQISGLLSSIISLNQDVSELIESNKQSVTNFVMYSESSDTLRMDMERIGGQGLTQTVQFGNAPVPPNPEPPLPDEVAIYYGWDANEMENMQASDFMNYQGTDERTANLYVTKDTLMDTQIFIERSDSSQYKYSYIAYPKGLVDPDPLKVVYSGFVDSWNNREMVIDGHTYIVIVPEYPNNLPTMDMKLSY